MAKYPTKWTAVKRGIPAVGVAPNPLAFPFTPVPLGPQVYQKARLKAWGLMSGHAITAILTIILGAERHRVNGLWVQLPCPD